MHGGINQPLDITILKISGVNKNKGLIKEV